MELLEDGHIAIQICGTGEGQVSDRLRKGINVQHEEAAKKRGAACGARNSGKQIERKTLGSGLNAGNIGAEIDVI